MDIYGNHAGGQGGGLYLHYLSSIQFKGIVNISNNTGGAGGGVSTHGTNLIGNISYYPQ